MCYATSSDGETWDRPALDIVKWTGTRPNLTEPRNVVLTRRSNTGVHGPIPPGGRCTATTLINASFPGNGKPCVRGSGERARERVNGRGSERGGNIEKRVGHTPVVIWLRMCTACDHS